MSGQLNELMHNNQRIRQSVGEEETAARDSTFAKVHGGSLVPPSYFSSHRFYPMHMYFQSRFMSFWLENFTEIKRSFRRGAYYGIHASTKMNPFVISHGNDYQYHSYYSSNCRRTHARPSIYN